MEQLGTYYFARVHMAGQLNKDTLPNVLASKHAIDVGDKKWMFANYESGANPPFHFARLCKFAPISLVKKIDTEAGLEYDDSENDVRIASSPFVFLPKYSCIAFLEVPGQITLGTFKTRFSELATRYFDDVFVECELEFISDYATFFQKIRELETIKLIEANVHPSNPRFQPFWRPLDEYLRRRKAGKLKIFEKAKKDEKLQSQLANIDESDLQKAGGTSDLVLTDAAVIMAADGYGKGKVSGTYRGKARTVSTAKTVANFDDSKSQEPSALASRVDSTMEKRERNEGKNEPK